MLEEDAHCQERALLDQVLIERGQLWIADRNFCVRTFLFRIARQGAYSLIRWHKTTYPFKPVGPLRACGRCETGEVFEQEILVEDPDGSGRHRLRRIVLKWDQPTRDGETEIVLVTNLPAEVSYDFAETTAAGLWFQVAALLLELGVLRGERRLLVLGDGSAWIRTWFEGSGVSPKAMFVCWYHLRKRCYEQLSAAGAPKDRRRALEIDLLGVTSQ